MDTQRAHAEDLDQGRSPIEVEAGFVVDTLRKAGLVGGVRRLAAAARLQLALPRTNRSVAAYFDLITDDARLFYGDSFHFGYFPNGQTTLRQGIDAHTDLVSELAAIRPEDHVLDVGCGIGAPAVHIARRHGCRLTGVNVSPEQVRQGRQFVSDGGLAHSIALEEANALELPFADETFDAAICLEAAGDICVRAGQHARLMAEIRRVLHPGGRVAFSDLTIKTLPTRSENRTMRSVLHHSPAELMTDWERIFDRSGFTIHTSADIISETMPTWEHALAVYEKRAADVERRYGRRVAARLRRHLGRIPEILERHGSYPVIGATKAG